MDVGAHAWMWARMRGWMGAHACMCALACVRGCVYVCVTFDESMPAIIDGHAAHPFARPRVPPESAVRVCVCLCACVCACVRACVSVYEGSLACVDLRDACVLDHV